MLMTGSDSLRLNVIQREMGMRRTATHEWGGHSLQVWSCNVLVIHPLCQIISESMPPKHVKLMCSTLSLFVTSIKVYPNIQLSPWSTVVLHYRDIQTPGFFFLPVIPTKKFQDVYDDIFSEILSAIVSDINSDILPDIFPEIYLTSIRHSPWHILWKSSGIHSAMYSCILSGIFLALYLTLYLAFYLAYIQTFYLTYVTIYSGILSGICSDILSGMYLNF